MSKLKVLFSCTLLAITTFATSLFAACGGGSCNSYTYYGNRTGWGADEYYREAYQNRLNDSRMNYSQEYIDFNRSNTRMNNYDRNWDGNIQNQPYSSDRSWTDQSYTQQNRNIQNQPYSSDRNFNNQSSTQMNNRNMQNMNQQRLNQMRQGQ